MFKPSFNSCMHVYLSNFGEFLQKVRSAVVLVGFKAINTKVSFKDMVRIMKAMVFKITD